MRIPRISRFAAKFEMNANTFADAAQSREYCLGALRSKLLGIIVCLIYALLWRIGVEVERFPCCAECVRCVIRVSGLVLLDSAEELFMADVALDKLDTKGSKDYLVANTQGQTVSETISMEKFVILGRVDLNASVEDLFK
jgi:hypothetical protein